jgi:hypothetical protein
VLLGAPVPGTPMPFASTSRRESVLPYLRQFGILDRFAHVVTRDAVPNAKPAPELYLEALSRLQLSPHEALAFEDSLPGLKAGGSNGEGQSGHGQVSYKGRTQLVHHVVFRLLVGEIPEGFQVRHADPRGRHFTLCCNPDHLEAMPKKEALRRRDRESARARRTHSPHGHAYTPENPYLDPRGSRRCRTCRAERVGGRRVPRAV